MLKNRKGLAMARFLKTFGDNSVALLIACFAIGMLLIAQPAKAGGGFANASERAQMCSAAANTVTSETGTECDKAILTKSGERICPTTQACAKVLEEELEK